jgi:galactose-1-phosphate uridylyltransferase
MSYDIYGNHLRPGYCEVHPNHRGIYPCDLCEEEIAENDYYKQQEKDYFRQQEEEYYAQLAEQEAYYIEQAETEFIEERLQIGL